MSGIEIQVRYDRKRGCGWRKPGGKYLIGGTLCRPCAKLPHFLTTCPTCGHGIKPMRGWRWIDAAKLFAGVRCPCDLRERPELCITPIAIREKVLCPLADPPDRAGLIWIGDAFYTPAEFIQEAGRLGISRRIPCVPKGFMVGETLVLLASRKVDRQVPLFTGLGDPDGAISVPAKGIFAAFIPTALEYVVRGDDRQEDLERLVKQGFTLVRIERVAEGGGDVSGSEGARPGLLEPGPPAVRPDGHGREDRALDGGDMPGWIV